MPYVGRLWSRLLLLFLPIVPLWRVVFLGETIGPWGQVLPMVDPKVGSDGRAWDVLQADGVLQFAPWRQLVLEAWGSRQMPWWNPYQLCGSPLMANSQSAALYPPHILLGLLHVPVAVAITLLAWLHLAWAGLGARALARSCGANEAGALFAGAAFSLSAFMVSWTPLASVVTTCSWIPWCLYAARRAIEEEDRGRWLAALAVSVGMTLLGGHLQFAAYGLMALVVFSALVAAQARTRVAVWAWLGTAVALGVMSSLPQVLPSLVHSRMSHRLVPPTAAGSAAYAASSLGVQDLAGLSVPAVTGLPGQPVAESDPAKPLPAFWPAYLRRGADFPETALGIGPFAVALLFLWRKDRWRDRGGPASVAALGALLAFGPLSLVLYWLLPGWSGTGSPGRAAVLLVLGLCLLAGTFWPEPLDDDAPAPSRGLVGTLLVTAATLAVAVLCSRMMPSWIPGFSGAEAVATSTLRQSLVWVGLSLALACAGVLLARRCPVPAVLVGIASTVCGGVVLCCPSGRTQAAPPPGVGGSPFDRLAYVNSDWGLLQRPEAAMPGNLASLFHTYDAAGYDSLIERDTLDLLRKANAGKNPAPPANGNMMFVKPGFDSRALADLGVTTVVTRGPNGLWLKSSLPGPGRVSMDTGSARMLSDGFDRQVVEATGLGILTVRDRNLPGWTATLDGRGVPIDPGPWRKVRIPEGRHLVEFHYQPPGFVAGLLFCIVGAAGAALLAALWPKPLTEPVNA